MALSINSGTAFSGSVQATRNASVEPLTPKNAASSRSRTSPSAVLTPNATPVITAPCSRTLRRRSGRVVPDSAAAPSPTGRSCART